MMPLKVAAHSRVVSPKVGLTPFKTVGDDDVDDDVDRDVGDAVLKSHSLIVSRPV